MAVLLPKLTLSFGHGFDLVLVCRYACGDNRGNKLGLDSRPGVLRTLSHRVRTVSIAWDLTRVGSIGKLRAETMSTGNSFGGVVTTGGTLHMFGNNGLGGLGAGDVKQMTGEAEVCLVVALDSSLSHMP